MHSVFRLVMLALVVGYSLPRVYYRRRARLARMKGESTRRPLTESKWRLVLMGISGGGANLVGFAWLVNPDWLSWSNLDLPVWLRWIGTGLGVLAIVLGSLSHRARRHGDRTAEAVRGREPFDLEIDPWLRDDRSRLDLDAQ